MAPKISHLSGIYSLNNAQDCEYDGFNIDYVIWHR